MYIVDVFVLPTQVDRMLILSTMDAIITMLIFKKLWLKSSLLSSQRAGIVTIRSRIILIGTQTLANQLYV
jgi:hypothetical protein